MKRLLGKRRFRLSAGLAALVLLAAVVATAGARHFRVWGWRDLRAYQGMSRECHPVWRDLNSGHIAAGQDVEEAIATTRPVSVERYGPFVRLNYQEGMSFTGVTVTAKNGRLVEAAAWSCTWERVFFQQLSPGDAMAYWDAYEAHWRPIRLKGVEAVPGTEADPPPD